MRKIKHANNTSHVAVLMAKLCILLRPIYPLLDYYILQLLGYKRVNDVLEKSQFGFSSEIKPKSQ